jgi:hypothetical protein
MNPIDVATTMIKYQHSSPGQKNNVSGEQSAAGAVTTLPPSVSRLSKQCGVVNISQRYRPPRLVTATVILDLAITWGQNCQVNAHILPIFAARGPGWLAPGHI